MTRPRAPAPGPAQTPVATGADVFAELAHLRAREPWWLPEHHLYHALRPFAATLTADVMAALAPELLAAAPVATYLHGEAFPAPAIRALVERIPADAEGWPCFLAAAVAGAGDDDALVARWRAATRCLHDLENGSGSGNEEVLRRVAADPGLVAACRRWMARAPWVHVPAILVRDGSAASAEALAPLAARALGGDADALDQLFALREWMAAAPALAALRDQVVHAGQTRAAASELPGWLAALGLRGVPEDTWLAVCLAGRSAGERVDHVGLDLHVAGARADAWRLELRDDGPRPWVVWRNGCPTSDPDLDPLDLDAPTLAGLPAWVARLGAVFEVAWSHVHIVAGSLDRDEAARVEAWLRRDVPGLPPALVTLAASGASRDARARGC